MKSPTKSGYYKPTAITKWRLSPLGSPLKLAPSQPFHRASSCPQMWSFPWSMTGWSAHTERTQSREEMMKKKWRLEAWGKEAKKQDCRGLYCCCGKGSVPDLGISTCCGHGQEKKKITNLKELKPSRGRRSKNKKLQNDMQNWSCALEQSPSCFSLCCSLLIVYILKSSFSFHIC